MLDSQNKSLVRWSNRLLWEGEFEMNTVKYLDEEIVIKRAIEVLIKELGPV